MFTEKIGTLTRTSNTTVQLTGNSLVKLGGQQRVLQSPSLSTAASGIGGLDTGSIANSTLYYVYAVFNGSATGLVASTSSVAPTGFTRSKKVGAFTTDTTGIVAKAWAFGSINRVSYSGYLDGLSVKVLTGDALLIFSSGSWANPYHILNVRADLGLTQPLVMMAHPDQNREVYQTYTVSAPDNSTVSVVKMYSYRADTNGVVQVGFMFSANKQGVDAIQPDWN
jgi:hypothetical protein